MLLRLHTINFPRFPIIISTNLHILVLFMPVDSRRFLSIPHTVFPGCRRFLSISVDSRFPSGSRSTPMTSCVCFLSPHTRHDHHKTTAVLVCPIAHSPRLPHFEYLSPHRDSINHPRNNCCIMGAETDRADRWTVCRPMDGVPTDGLWRLPTATVTIIHQLGQ